MTCQGEKSDIYLALKNILLAIISKVASISKKSQFGKNVCRLRSEKKLTQERLAEKADISRRYLQQIEAGEMNPTVGVAARLRAALQCSWDQLFDKL